eukprot:15332543-Ditylum_brightwellii.AAC.1
MESLCTKSAGGLALLRFLIRYIAYHSITPRPDAILHYSDNKVIAGRINWQLLKIIENSNEYLSLNFDLKMAINTPLAELGIPLTSSHVLGHHDQKNKVSKSQQQTKGLRATSKTWDKCLKWEAALNIVADNLATVEYYILNQTNCKGSFDPILSGKIYIYINGLPIVKSYRKHIINAWSSQVLWEYTTTTFNWKTGTADKIAWEIYGNLYKKKKFNDKYFITRYVHHVFLVLGIKSTVTSTIICMRCRAAKETALHFAYCHANQER